ncbi:MAG: hypothetical protein OQK82_03050 [Candidatus Pacearchaeota archaeon]|nr:hypothetical protein [Candidatus Pacearchaeota archaeon]
MKFPFLVRKSVPDELPELISDKIEKSLDKGQSNDVDDFLKKEEGKIGGEDKVESFKVEQNSLRVDNAESKDKLDEVSDNLPDALPVVGEKGDSATKIQVEKSFFEDLEKEVNDEVEDLDKLEEWYKNKFLPGDIVSDMREYWENQKSDSILKILGKNLQDKISKKIQDLQILEKQWQAIYFDLIEKEEEIKKEESELKEILAEFMKICKTKNEEGKQKKSAKKKSN